jgi:hypothetical protein
MVRRTVTQLQLVGAELKDARDPQRVHEKRQREWRPQEHEMAHPHAAFNTDGEPKGAGDNAGDELGTLARAEPPAQAWM